MPPSSYHIQKEREKEKKKRQKALPVSEAPENVKNGFVKPPEISEMKLGQFLVVIYTERWWIGTVENVSVEDSDVKIRFMRPHGPKTIFEWPEREDTLGSVQKCRWDARGATSAKC